MTTAATNHAAQAAVRPPLLVQGLLAAGAGGLLTLAALPASWSLAIMLLVLQVVLVLGLLALVDAPAAVGVFGLAALSALAADVVVLVQHDDAAELPGVGGLAGVVALSLVAALLHQLVRRQRERVTESLADTLLVVVATTSFACLLALRSGPTGRDLAGVAVAAGAACLLFGRLGDLFAPAVPLRPTATRSLFGLLLGLFVGELAAVGVALASDEVPTGRAALLGLAVALAVAAADLLVDLAAPELQLGIRDERRVEALRPVAALLPYAVLGPVALVVAQLALP